MKTFSKTVLACAVSAACLFTGSVAQAAIFNQFTFSHTEGAVTTTLDADKITGNYVEVATFGAGTFDVSLYWRAGQFVTDGGESPYEAGVSRLGVDYGIYALYQASGTFSTSGTATTFNFTPGSGSFAVFLDENGNTTKTNPLVGTGAFILANTGDDVELASGIALAGQGTLDPALPTCSAGGGSGINCGSFGSTTTFNLTSPDGPAFFIAPNPFYNLSFQSGQFNNFSPTGTQTINGSLDVVFSEVPEPGTTALLGLGLLGLGFTVRRRKQS